MTRRPLPLPACGFARSLTVAASLPNPYAGAHRVADSLDVEQLDVEDQHALRLARRAVVGQFGPQPEATPLAGDHHLDAIGPALDNSVAAELRRLSARDRAV